MNSNKKKVMLDDTDWKLIEELYRNPRQPIKLLAEKLGVHRNTITSKLERDIFDQIIFPKYEVLGYITAYVFSTIKADRNNKMTAELISTYKGVEEVSVISGEWDFIIKIRALSIEQIGLDRPLCWVF